MYIKSIRVTDYKLVPGRRQTDIEGGYVQYVITVQGKTEFLHPLSYIDMETCLRLDLPVFKTSSRFSELSDLHKQLQVLHAKQSLPAFPPKRWLGNKSSTFITERMRQLNTYFSGVLDSELICASSLWTRVFPPQEELRFAVVGCPGIGKIRFVEGFLNCTVETRHHLLPSPNASRDSFLGQVCPIDIIVNQVLVRMKSLTILQYNQDSDASAMKLLRGYDGIVLAYLERRPETYEAVEGLRRRLETPSVLVCLDTEALRETKSIHVKTAEDAFLTFYHLIERRVLRMV